MTTAAAAAVDSGSNGAGTISTATGTATSTNETGAVSPRAEQRAIRYWSRHIRSFRTGTQRWLAVMSGRPPRGGSRSLTARSLERLRQIATVWRHREHAAWWRASHPPGLRGWLCIHHYEGSWTDAGSPYWGGLQMDFSFQATYGGWLLRHKGTADHWSPLEQIWVAVRASRVRGFSPWPNTARFCGLA
jgi:hypothetical protein